LQTEGVVDVITPAAEPACPYRGPAVFQPTDAGWFFGRTNLVEQLVSRLQDRTTLVVAGPSQCGKSSVVRAGLLPALAADALPGRAGWPQSVFVPGSHPLDALWGALGRLSEEPLPDIFSLEEAPGSAATRLVGEGVLVVDQFETIFAAAPDPAERGAFLSVLEALCSEKNVRLVLCIGTEFYGTCSAVPWLASAISENHVLVGRPSAEELREVIEGPARRGGLRLEEGLADLMLDDVRSDPAPLAALSRVLRETWNLRKGRILTIEGCEQAQGSTGSPTQAPDPAGGEPQRAATKPAVARSPVRPQPSVAPFRPPADAGGQEEIQRTRRIPPVLVALFLLALLASLALGILLTQMAH
jgi:hypothetical protein